MKKILLILSISFTVLTNVNAKVYITTKDVNIRAGAGNSYQILGTVKAGTTVDISEIVGSWGKTNNNEKDGFISTNFLNEIPQQSTSTTEEEKKRGSDLVLYFIIFILIVYAFRKTWFMRYFFPSTIKFMIPSRSEPGSKRVVTENDRTYSGTIPVLTNIRNGSTSSKQHFLCEFCGTEASSVSSLTAQSCVRHPNGMYKGKHSLYQGSEKDKYTCRLCGTTALNISSLTSQSCVRHPNGMYKGKHEPAL